MGHKRKKKELTIKKGEFLKFIKESKAFTESWPAWKKECVQAVSRDKERAETARRDAIKKTEGRS